MERRIASPGSPSVRLSMLNREEQPFAQVISPASVGMCGLRFLDDVKSKAKRKIW